MTANKPLQPALVSFFILAAVLSYPAHATEERILDFGEYIGKMYSDGSGHLGKRFDPSMTLSCKSFACEHKRRNADADTTFNNTWAFHVRIDEMTDQKIITTSRRPYKLSAEFGEMALNSNVYLWLDLSSVDQEILCVGGHDFPGMKAMVRVNSNSPIETNEEGCISLT